MNALTIIAAMASGKVTADNSISATSDHPNKINPEDARSQYLAQPSADCCLKGTFHEGTPRGAYQSVADVDTYVVHPPSGKANGHILLYYPDVWGMFNNGLLIMDGFADAGYLTVGLDYFRGVC